VQGDLQRKLAQRQAKLVGDVKRTIRGVARKFGPPGSPSSSRPGSPKVKVPAANAANGNGRVSPSAAAAAEANGNGRASTPAAAGGAVGKVKELMNVLRSK
jgi:hypothetical protein